MATPSKMIDKISRLTLFSKGRSKARSIDYLREIMDSRVKGGSLDCIEQFNDMLDSIENSNPLYSCAIFVRGGEGMGISLIKLDEVEGRYRLKHGTLLFDGMTRDFYNEYILPIIEKYKSKSAI